MRTAPSIAATAPATVAHHVTPPAARIATDVTGIDPTTAIVSPVGIELAAATEITGEEMAHVLVRAKVLTQMKTTILIGPLVPAIATMDLDVETAAATTTAVAAVSALAPRARPATE